MEKSFENVWPIWDIDGGFILSKQGDYTLAFEVMEPEIFTLSGPQYEELHQGYVKAARVLPAGSIIHKQDWYYERAYTGKEHSKDQEEAKGSFLAEAAERFFEGRRYIGHKSYLFLTKTPKGSKGVNSAASGLFRQHWVPPETIRPAALQEFRDQVGQFRSILESMGLVKLRPLEAEEIWSYTGKIGILEQYCYLSAPGETPVIRDMIVSGTGMRIGNRHGLLFTLADAEKLPAQCRTWTNHEGYSTDRTKFSVGFSAGLGCLLPCNHIYNQYLVIGDGPATLKKLESRRLRLQSLSKYSRENSIAKESVESFLNESIAEQRIPVRAHFNVFAWTENPEELGAIRNRVSSAFAQMEAAPHEETVGAAQIWWAGIPGNAGDLPVNETFDTFLDQGVCFLNLETNYRSDAAGTRFGDRLTGRPVLVDLFEEPMRKGVITNRNLFVCGSSGGGKSVTLNHILRTLYDTGAHVVTVDIGGSYKGLCTLLKGRYFVYEEANPIAFNPFFIRPGQSLDIEKKEGLKALLVSLWKQEDEAMIRSEYVALSNALQGFYQWLDRNGHVFPCFNSFYDYLVGEYAQVLRESHVRDKDFDMEHFLYVLRPFYKGGEFDYLLNAIENLDLVHERFIVFELDNIRDHPILFPVVTLIIMELFLEKMRHLRGVPKALVIEEAWKAIARAGMAGFMRYAVKTLRKFYGIFIVATQEVEDLIGSPIIKEAIIGNTDIKVLMDMRKFMNKFDALQALLGLSDKGKMLLLSLNRDNEPGRIYREVYIDLGGQLVKVVRNELSPEEYWCYTTEEREKVRVMEYAARYGSMEKGIARLVEDVRKERRGKE